MTFSSHRDFTHSTLSPLFKAPIFFFQYFNITEVETLSFFSSSHIFCIRPLIRTVRFPKKTMARTQRVEARAELKHRKMNCSGEVAARARRRPPAPGASGRHRLPTGRGTRETRCHLALQAGKILLLRFQKPFLRCFCATLLSAV